jgi:hypothetical protein
MRATKKRDITQVKKIQDKYISIGILHINLEIQQQSRVYNPLMYIKKMTLSYRDHQHNLDMYRLTERTFRSRVINRIISTCALSPGLSIGADKEGVLAHSALHCL